MLIGSSHRDGCGGLPWLQVVDCASPQLFVVPVYSLGLFKPAVMDWPSKPAVMDWPSKPAVMDWRLQS